MGVGAAPGYAHLFSADDDTRVQSICQENIRTENITTLHHSEAEQKRTSPLSRWWAWVLAGLAVLYLFNAASGSIYTRKLWSMLHDQIVRRIRPFRKSLKKMFTTEPLRSRRSFHLLSGRETTTGQNALLPKGRNGFSPAGQKLLICPGCILPGQIKGTLPSLCPPCLCGESMSMRLHEIETRLNAVASNLPPLLLISMAWPRDSRSEDIPLFMIPPKHALSLPNG